jgi:hypothetical protein
MGVFGHSLCCVSSHLVGRSSEWILEDEAFESDTTIEHRLSNGLLGSMSDT